MPIQTSPHGIGSVINKINNEYQEEYNTTSNIFNTEGDDVTVEVENTTVTSNAYNSFNSGLQNGNYYNSPSYPTINQGTIVNQYSTHFAEFYYTASNSTLAARAYAVDPTDGTLWQAYPDGEDNYIYQYDWEADSSSTIGFVSSGENVGIDSNTGIIYTNLDATVYQYDRNGNELGTITLADAGGTLQGFTIDTDSTLWYTDYSTVYHADTDGSLLTSWATPTNAGREIAIDYRDGTIWWLNDDDATDPVYHIDRTGTVINSFTTPSLSNYDAITQDPLDGSIWVCDRYNGEFAKYCTSTAGCYAVDNGVQTIAVNK